MIGLGGSISRATFLSSYVYFPPYHALNPFQSPHGNLTNPVNFASQTIDAGGAQLKKMPDFVSLVPL